MIVVDTSALMAIIGKEPECDQFTDLLLADPVVLISAVNYYEAKIVVSNRLGPLALDELDVIISNAGCEVMAFDLGQAAAAHAAYLAYGKGRHPAGLNFADCAAFALAAAFDAPLFCKGEDFARTTIKLAAGTPR